MNVPSERIDDLIKLSSLNEAVVESLIEPPQTRPQRVKSLARVLLGHEPTIPIEALLPEDQTELLFVMRAIRDQLNPVDSEESLPWQS